MSDPFEVLRSPNRRVEPDVEFRHRVMHDVDVAIDSRDATAAVDGRQEMTLEENYPTHRGHGHLWPLFIVLAAAAAAVVALAAAVILRDREASEPPVIQQPSTTVAVDSETAFDSGIAAEMARSMLIDPAADYAPGWTAAPVQPMTLDRSVAAAVPGCAPFLETVFEGPDRPARVDYRFFHLGEATLASQYVVVFPSETEAAAMFEATVDPRFQDECLVPYYEQTDAYGGWCCDPSEHATPALFGTPVETDFAVVADDMQRRLQTDAFWIDEAGVSHGPERRESATMRIGRTVIVMDAVLEGESGEEVMAADQFDTALANAAVLARAMTVGYDE